MQCKVLITGGAGFIGAHLAAHLLAAGHQVHLLDNFSRGRDDPFLARLSAHPQARLWRLDLLAPDGARALPQDYSQIFHFAALLGVHNVLQRPYATLSHNVLLLLNALELARRQTRLQRFVFASTSEVYAGALEWLEMPLPTPEDTALALPHLAQPRSSYMLSKLYGEALVQHAGLPFTIVRPHNVYGPRMGMAHVVPQLLQKAHRAPQGGSLEVFSVDHRRTFCYIDDAVQMLHLAATLPQCQAQVLNLGNQRPEVRMDELAGLILATLGKPLALVPQPATAGSPARRCPDMTRMRALTGYQGRVELADGLRRTYDWYRHEVFDADPPPPPP